MMNNKPFKIISEKIESFTGGNLHEKIFLSAFCMLIAVYSIGMTPFEISEYPMIFLAVRLLRYILIGSMVFSAIMFCGQYTVKELLWYTVIGCLLLYGSVCSHDKGMLLSFVVILGAKNVSIRKAAKISFIIYSVITALVIALFMLGVLPENIMDRGEDVIRHSLGFNHPNLLGLYVFIPFFAFTLCYPEKTRGVMFYLSGLVLAAFLWFVPNSRTSAFSIILMLAAVPMGRSRLIKGRFFKAASLMLPGILSALSVVCIFIYDAGNGFMALLNKLFTGRLMLASLSYERYGWGGLWGKVHIPMDIDVPIDNCYARLFLYFGLFAFIIFMGLLYTALVRSIKENRFDIVMLIVVFSIFGVFELYTIISLYDLCLLAVTADISDIIGETNDQTVFRIQERKT